MSTRRADAAGPRGTVEPFAKSCIHRMLAEWRVVTLHPLTPPCRLMRHLLRVTASVLLALPALAQPTAPLYDAARDAGASDADAAGLAKALAVVQEAQLLASGGAADDVFG